MEWKSKFNRIILGRGEEYFRRGRVKNLTEKNGRYTASVVGEVGYSVYIGIKDGSITRMSCNCPYAGGGNKCKHMAATLYAIEEAWEQEEAEKEARELDEKMDLMGKVNPETEEADEEKYQYFDIDKIKESMKLDSTATKAAQKLIFNKEVLLENVSTGYTNNTDTFVAHVHGKGIEGKNTFEVSFLASRNKIEGIQCYCSKCRKNYYGWYVGGQTNCGYKAGLLFLFKQYLVKNNIGDATDRSSALFLNNFIEKKAKTLIADVIGENDVLNLVPRINYKDRDLELSFRVGSSKLFVVKNLTKFCEQISNCELAEFGSNTQLNVKLENFSEKSKKYIEFIQRVVTEENEYSKRLTPDYGHRSVHEVGQSIALYGWRLDQFFDMVPKNGVEYEEGTGRVKKKGTLTCAKANPDIYLTIDKEELDSKKEFHGVSVTGELPDIFKGVTNGYFLKEMKLCRIEDDFMNHIKPLQQIARSGHVKLQIGRKHLSELYYTILPELEEYVHITRRNADEIEKYLPPEVNFVFYLDTEDGDIICKPCAKYGEAEFSLLDIPKAEKLNKTLAADFREEGKESEVLFQVKQWFPEIDYDRDCLFCNKDEEAIYRVLSEGVEGLLTLGEVQSTDRFKRMNIARKPKISVGVSLESGLLNLEITTDDIPQEELLDILKSYRLKKKYHRLKNGDFLDLEDDSMYALNEMMESLHISPKEFVKGKMKLPAYRALYLEKMLEEHESIYANRDSHFRTLVKDFKTVSEADYEEPAELKKILRNYQKEGYRWLRTLETNQLGGILADDMGLGKTLQVIAVLLAAKKEKKVGTSLIICPASLVFNWGEELSHFAPKLSVGLVSGNQTERKKMIKQAKKHDVLVTSYDLLKRDIADYEGISFSYEVIDEAQYIKNHTTEAAKAVKIVTANVRYALTGTPIENRLSELWSIFDYLMPGFLYGYDVFRREFETPIVKNGDDAAMERLQKMVRPFILRRLKEEVLKDLPDKLEEIQFAGFEEKQQKLYDAQVVHMQQTLAAQDNDEFSKNKIQILAEITKLRQICCDPTLCFEDYKGSSAKREACLELVERAIEGGHKILLFSQFTTMLAILEKELKERGISYYMITGATPKEKRLEMVKKFNTDDTKIFLISLKAGGTGLNLTGADVVIHYDPWWNLAVQNQATDRAHRIGQQKKVTVYKLLMKNTIEEKIQKIQDTKKDLAEQILSGEMGQLAGMSREELLELLE